jgi:hypothetical protein
VLLFAHQVRLGKPGLHLVVNFSGIAEPKRMELIARREVLETGES